MVVLMKKLFTIFLGLILTNIAIASPDRYSEYFMKKNVDWFSLGIYINRQVLTGVFSQPDFPKGVGIGLIYDWEKDEFRIWASGGDTVTDQKCIDALGHIRMRFAIDKDGIPFEFGPTFHSAFLPNGYSYNDVPSNVDEKMADKVIFTCNDKTYTLMN